MTRRAAEDLLTANVATASVSTLDPRTEWSATADRGYHGSAPARPEGAHRPRPSAGDGPGDTGDSGPDGPSRHRFRAPLGLLAVIVCVALGVSYAVGRAGDPAPASGPLGQSIANQVAHSGAAGSSANRGVGAGTAPQAGERNSSIPGQQGSSSASGSSSSTHSSHPKQATASPAAKATTPTKPPAAQSAQTAGNTSSSAAGALAPGLTAYAVPGNAVFVSPSGSTSGNGSKGSPVRTVAQAVKIARSGSTIVLRGGVYHESVQLPLNKVLTIQSYPHEAVWFDGSSAVSGWSRSGNGWVHTNWTAHFDHSPDWATSGSITKQNPMAAYPDQVWINGAAQTQVGSLSQLGAGKFYVDTSNKRLYVGSNPGNSVRASDLQMAVWMTTAGSALKGVGVRNYATSIAQKGSIRVRGDGDVVQNVLVLNSATIGMDLTADNLRVDHVTVQNAGLLGVHAGMADGLQFTNSLLRGNDSQLFAYKPVAGGIKVGSSRNVRFSGNVVDGNHAIGAWFDVSSANIIAASNTFTHNLVRGLQLEISQNAIVVDNTFTDNGMVGVYVLDTGGVKIWNNTFQGNPYRDISILQDRRTPSNYPAGYNRHGTAKLSWVSSAIISNNLLLSSQPQFMLSVYDASRKRSGSAMAKVDGNVFARPPVAHHYEIAWSRSGGGVTSYLTPADFTKGTGQGHSNRDFVASRTKASSAAANGAPLAMPSDVAAAAGRATGTKHVGAF